MFHLSNFKQFDKNLLITPHKTDVSIQEVQEN